MAEPGTDPGLVALPAIAALPDPDPAFEARALFDEGLAEVRRLARALWTDHNTHDPGITTLELLGYALTELAYRHALPIEDLLAAPGAEEAARAARLAAQFHAPREVLPNRPLTALDWRKGFIDLEQVRNAWIEPVTDVALWADLRRRVLQWLPPPHEARARVPLAGLVKVRVEFMDGVSTLARREQVLRAVRETFAAARNLCEDLVEVRPVRAQFFALCAEIELEVDADATEVAAQLLFAAENQLSPPVPTHTLEALRARGRTLAEIFEGPALAHGFIDDADLRAAALPAEIRLSDLMGVLMDVPGLRALRALQLNPIVRADEDDEDALDADAARIVGDAVPVANPWRVPVRAGRLPRLSLAHGRLVLTKRKLPVAGYNLAQLPAAVAARLAALRADERARTERPADTSNPSLPAGRLRQLAAWRSVQLDFPALYGIGAAGLGERADSARRAQALQLQGWLLFFDQLMANQLALLAQARHRLSVAPTDLDDVVRRFSAGSGERHVLAAQLVHSVVGHERLYAPGTTDASLADVIEPPAQANARQQRLLDHLLARLAEDFADYAAVMASAFGNDEDRRIADKCHFLRQAAALARDRAGGHLLHPPSAAGVWNTPNVSGLERRVARLLGIVNANRRNLGLVSHDTYAELDATPGDEFRWRVRHALTNAIVLSSSTRYVTREAARAEMTLAIARAQQPDGYQRKRDARGRHYFNIVDAGGAVIGRRIAYFADAAALEAAITALAAYLRDHYSGEGLYVVEHLLLRPLSPADPVMQICADAGDAECADLDPYSYRMHVVLPAYAGRFRDMGFRAFAEATIRRETPAHILPTVCWIGPEHMARFEAAWRAWLELQAGVSRSGRAAKLAELLAALDQIKNVYPVRQLFDCTGDDTKPPFIVGRTSLGRGPGSD